MFKVFSATLLANLLDRAVVTDDKQPFDVGLSDSA